MRAAEVSGRGRGVVRTLLAAAEVWLLTVVAHSLAGGALPSVGWLVGVGGLVVVATAWVLRRRITVWAAAAALALAQLGLHLALTAASGPVMAGHASTAMSGHAHHVHGGPVPSAGPSLLDGLSTQMVLAHVLSALVTAFVWWLRRRALETVLRLARAPVLPIRHRDRPAARRPRTRSQLRPWLLGDPGRAPPPAFATA